MTNAKTTTILCKHTLQLIPIHSSVHLCVNTLLSFNTCTQRARTYTQVKMKRRKKKKHKFNTNK